MHFEISDDLVNCLREDLLCRRIGQGLELLRRHPDVLTYLAPENPNASTFLGYFSQWVDIGYGDSTLVRDLLGRFRKKTSLLTVHGFVHLKLAEGLVAFAELNAAGAIRHFDFIVALGQDSMPDRAPLALAHFWIGRCERMLCQYTSALAHVSAGRELMLDLGYPKMAAVMQVLESWLYLQGDHLPQGLAVLEQAEAVIRDTDDLVMLGNIHAGYGRIALREGCYEQALEHMRTSSELYSRCDPEHSNLAGCLKNMARAKRLIGLRLIRRIDTVLAEHRTLRRQALVPVASAPSRRLYEQLRAESFDLLFRAEGIYRTKNNIRGLGLIRVVRAFLCMDDGDLEHGAVEAEEGFRLGNDKNDYFVMAHARVLQSTIESALYEEGILDQGDVVPHAQRACDFAADALIFAKRSGDSRLLARAYIAKGLALCNDYFNDLEGARECCDQAANYFTPEHRDHVWDDFQLLKSKVQRITVDGTLQKWSIGSIEGKTFQQMTEEFEEAIIPKVWELEERKIVRAAKRLSISPKKVRRILNRLGLESH